MQTLADLGLVGLILALALLLAWMAAAGRPTHPFNRRWTSWRAWLQLRLGCASRMARLRERELTRYTPERIGMLSMLCLVVVFGAHSLIDWTWYVPGDACVALLCAGWLAGRGELVAAAGGERRAPAAAGDAPPARGARPAALPRAWPERPHARWPSPARDRRGAAGDVVAVAAAALRRSRAAGADAQLEAHHAPAALAAADSGRLARPAVDRSAVHARQRPAAARAQPELAQATLEKAVRLQPSNPQTWLALGRYELQRRPRGGRVKELRGGDLPEPRVDLPEAIADGRRSGSDRNPRTTSSNGCAAPAAARPSAAQKRERTACASSTRGTSAGAPAPRTSICSKPKSSSSRASVRRL